MLLMSTCTSIVLFSLKRQKKLVQRRTLMLNHLTIEIRIQQVKRGNLGETSPLLNDISSVPTWDKINSGLLRMYKGECLGKHSIVQHFLFGSIIRLKP
mmetsp:Transcript_12659/g.53431  ORF Transcript_12659/g.53431 Transcript_12659/m.53431 type:complete len:98 (-) Transcript_12659:2461-2754(-)